jgi:hypothetical protein
MQLVTFGSKWYSDVVFEDKLEAVFVALGGRLK